MYTQLFESNDARELALELHVDHEPARRIALRVGVVVIMFWIKRGGIRVAVLRDADDAGDSGDRAAGMVEECFVALLDGVSEHVPRLKIANSVPCGRLLGCHRKVVDAECIRFGLEKPVVHGAPCCSTVDVGCDSFQSRLGGYGIKTQVPRFGEEFARTL